MERNSLIVSENEIQVKKQTKQIDEMALAVLCVLCNYVMNNLSSISLSSWTPVFN